MYCLYHNIANNDFYDIVILYNLDLHLDLVYVITSHTTH